MQKISGAIFDLDGVIVDTAKYHYLAWKRLASEIGFNFTEKENEQLKGISRMQSLEILLKIGKISANENQKKIWASKKNEYYIELLQNLNSSSLLPGTQKYLMALKSHAYKIALGSASKNAPYILSKLKITNLFDVIVDGNTIKNAKPDPEVFLKGAELLHLEPDSCAVFEDSLAGIKAAKSGGMFAVGIGKPENLPGADLYALNLEEVIKMRFPFSLC